MIKSKEQALKQKHNKVPGTPGVALRNGWGVLSLADVMVTWVFTDVADSTRLWEWNPGIMDRAIDVHNQTIRALLEEYGGHEIRNEGDSFTLSFHEAPDAVRFCLKVMF
jgi:class 3 adenylate cyclase